MTALEELQAREWPSFTDEQVDAILAKRDAPAWLTREMVEEHLSHYVNDDCPGCGRGMFGWGLAHGEGACSCGWPGTMYHFIRRPEGEERFRFVGILWAHPNDVRRNTP